LLRIMLKQWGRHPLRLYGTGVVRLGSNGRKKFVVSSAVKQNLFYMKRRGSFFF